MKNKKTKIYSLLAVVILVLVGFIAFYFYSNNDDGKFAKLVNGGSISEQNFSKTLPFRYIKKHIYLDVVVKGKTYTFVFDTGADITSIDKKLVKELNFVPKIDQKVSGSSFKEMTVQYGTIANPLTIAGIDFKNIAVGAQDLSFLKSLEDDINDGTKLSGIIGANMIKKAFWQIDYANKKITFSDKIDDLIADEKTITIDMIAKNTENWGSKEIKVTLNGYEQKFILDTGSFGNFSTNTEVLKTLLKNATKPVKEITDKETTKRKEDDRIFNVNYLTIGSIKLDNQKLLVEKGIGTLIGNTFLEKYVITLDFQNNKLYLKENKK